MNWKYTVARTPWPWLMLWRQGSDKKGIYSLKGTVMFYRVKKIYGANVEKLSTLFKSSGGTGIMYFRTGFFYRISI